MSRPLASQLNRGLIALVAASLVARREFAQVSTPRIIVESARWAPGVPFRFRAEGLPRSALATITMETHDVSGNAWRSRATWRVDPDGNVDPTRAAPLEGTYATIDGSGLVWSMAQETGGPTLFTAPDSDRVAFDLSVSVDSHVLASSTAWRYRAADGVGRRLLRTPVVGALFEPQDGRRHPAVLLLGGSGGGHPLDDQAAALAADGYVTLSLAYYGAPGLPSQLVRVPVESAERGIEWLRGLSSVDPRRIAVIGHSRGSELAQLVAATDTGVSAVVLLAGSPVAWPGIDPARLGADVPSWTVSDSAIATLASGKFFGQVLREGRPPIAAFERALSDSNAVAGAMLPILQIRGPMLWVSGDSDAVWPANDLASRAIAWRRQHHVPFTDQWMHFGDAGHWLFIDGAPLDHRVSLPLPGRTVSYGGTMESDAIAARDAWSAIREFLRAALRDPHKRSF